MTTSPENKPVTGWQRTLVIRIDKTVYWFSKHWLGVFNSVAFLYVALPILAPILMNAGFESPASVIYKVYSPLCHQMAQRTFFLFGEQSAYPREIAGTNLTPIEAYTSQLPEFNNVDPGDWPAFFAAARKFVGNQQLGYKMSLCERDLGIYGFVLVGGLLYAMLRHRRKVKPISIWFFIVLGLGPIAIDGFSQLFFFFFSPSDGTVATGFLATIHRLLPLRESSPLLRALTGAIFGLSLVWMAYPRIDEGMWGTRKDLGKKLRRIGEIK